MTLRSAAALANTRDKLRRLDEHYKARSQETPDNPRVHELTLRSLKRTINQFTEEIARYESRQPVRGESAGILFSIVSMSKVVRV